MPSFIFLWCLSFDLLPTKTTSYQQDRKDKKMSNTTNTDSPFSQEMVNEYNQFTHYEISLERITNEFNKEVASDREMATTRLAKYSINEMPEDVQKRLDRLKQARRYIFIADVRSRRLAPPPTVVGWSKYHKYARVDKANRVLEKAFEMLEKAKYNLSVALARYSPDRPISSDDVNAIDKLKEKLAKAEALQVEMKAANKIVQNKKLSDEEKTKQLKAIGLSGILLQPDCCGRKGFADYQLTNNNANIRRMKARIAEIEKQRKDVEKSWTDGSIRIVDSPTENRLQIFFPDKPSVELRARLKQKGFKWSPTSGAWQRFRSNGALYDASVITGIKTDFF